MDRAFGVYDLRTVRDMSVFADDPDAMAELDDVLQNVGHLSEPLLLRPQGPSEWNPDCPEAAWWPKYDPSPPGIIYDPCHKSAINTINKHYAPLGFAVVIRYTNFNKKTGNDKFITSVILRCAAGRSYTSASTGQRPNQCTLMTECKWKGVLKRQSEDGEVSWAFSAFNDSHNHPRAMERFHGPSQHSMILIIIPERWSWHCLTTGSSMNVQ